MAGNFHGLTGDQVINAKQRIEYASSTINYYGLAAPGTVTSAAGWQIRRETLDSQQRTIQIDFAGGTLEYGQVWDNRATLSYS
jgi:hypothetical protein